MTENYPPIDELDELSFRSYAMFVQAKLMPSIFDLKKLLEIAIDAFVELLRVDVGYIMLFDEKSRQLSVEAVKGLKRHTIRKTRINVNKDIIQGIIERKAAIFLSELEETLPIKILFQKMAEKAGGDIVLSIPLVIKKDLLGLVNLSGREFETPFKQKDLRFLYTLADYIAMAIQNANLYRKKIEVEKLRTIEYKRAEEALKETQQYTRGLIEANLDALVMISAEGKITDVNQATEFITGMSRKEIVGTDFSNCFTDPDASNRSYQQVFRDGYIRDYPLEIKHRDGKVTPVLYNASVYKDAQGRVAGAFVAARDISEQKQLETQLAQAQKMESIGILAGGIAHDFNNILTTIIGNAELALMDVIKDESLRNGIKEIKKAGEKAAFLTHQLLAFSRKQILQPMLLDINEVLTDIEKMLGRLIGEDIELLTNPAPALWQVEIDPGQIEQVIMNLAINARDAMPKGGKLTIETANADLNENYFREYGIEGKKSGHYVMLAVSDTGSGMDKETREHIFDPFFTTKEVGQGTGLGLSTIYGIVKQNNGFIWVYSEPGKGTIFKVYLPNVKDSETEEKEQTPVDDPGGSETVLIVEDDDNLRKFAQKALRQQGYKLLVAKNGEDALRVCKEHDGQIDLMITDVVMPKMGGREAAKRLQPLYPEMKVIYMSGYTDDAIVHHGVLEPGLNFLEKPFTPKGLALKVREVLDQEDLEQ